MPVDFLSDAQAARYGCYTDEPNPNQLAQFFYLDDTDHASPNGVTTTRVLPLPFNSVPLAFLRVQVAEEQKTHLTATVYQVGAFLSQKRPFLSSSLCPLLHHLFCVYVPLKTASCNHALIATHADVFQEMRNSRLTKYARISTRD